MLFVNGSSNFQILVLVMENKNTTTFEMIKSSLRCCREKLHMYSLLTNEMEPSLPNIQDIMQLKLG